MRVTLGRALTDQLPATLAAWMRGDLGLSHAWEIVRATRDIKDDPELVASLDAALAGATPALSPADVKDLADRIRAQHAPDQTEKKNADQHARQQLTMSKTMDGMWDVHGRLDPEAGTLVNSILGSFEHRPTADEILADPAGSQTPGQRWAAALVEICRQAQDHAQGCNGQGGGRNTMIVAISLADLRSGRGVGDVAGGGLLPAGALRR